MDLLSALVILGLILILGFIGNYIFNKTQIPSIVWLLLFGLIVGFLFRIQNFQTAYPEFFYSESGFTIPGFIGAIAIVIILFDGGINTDLHLLFKGAPRGLLLTVSSFCLSFLATLIIIVSLDATGLLNIPGDSFIIGSVLGAIVGGTSSPIVIPLAYKLKNLQDKTKMVSSIESILTDPLCIVVVFAISYMVLTVGEINLTLGIGNLIKTFSVGIILGLALGIVWLFIMNKVKKEQFSYVLTLAFVFLVYSFTAIVVGTNEGGEGAGAIACLFFGLVLGNGKKILKMINYSGQKFEMDAETKQFHALISFIIRTFFFVYLGMIVSFQNLNYILIGIIVLIGLILVRFLAVEVATFKDNFEKDDKQTMIAMMPRGLAAAILAINFGPKFVTHMPDCECFFKDVAFVIILGTAIITTIGVSFISHNEMKKIKNSEKEKDKTIYEKIDKISEKTDK